MKRRDFIRQATAALAAAGAGGCRMFGRRKNDQARDTRGVVVSARDLSGAFDWPRLAREAGLNTVATHIGPRDVMPFMQSGRGARFVDACARNGLQVEHELHALDWLLPRAMFATVLHRAAGAPEAEGAPGFTDVRPGAWYAAAVAWAAETGVVTGRSAERFDPDAALTREQAITLLWRRAGCPEGEAAALEGFSDAEAVSAWAREAFAWAVGAGIVSGRGDGSLDPRAGTNRAEAAQMLMRFAEM